MTAADRADLTAAYLDEITRSGVPVKELLGGVFDNELINAYFPGEGRFLPRPVFLGRRDREQLYADIETIRLALISLPDRLYGGDVTAFARAVGLHDVQISAMLRGRGTGVTRQARADLFADANGFKLLEFNMGSALGGMDNGDIAKILLEHPLLSRFADEHGLSYVDTMHEHVETIRAESGLGPGSNPMVVAADWPSSYENLAPFMRQYREIYRGYGLDAHETHIGRLEVRDGGVWFEGRRVDVLIRLFMISDLLENPEAPALMEPILDAAARGEVRIFSPLDTEMFASKGALAMLSDEANLSRFDPAELASLDRILPWTRMLRPGPVTLEDGSSSELVEYVLGARTELVIKPTLLHGGEGVLLGWHSATTPELWEERVRAALDGPYVVQRRVHPVPELFPDENGELVPWTVNWGVYTMARGYGGSWARANTVDSGIEVLNVDGGAYVGSCLHAV